MRGVLVGLGRGRGFLARGVIVVVVDDGADCRLCVDGCWLCSGGWRLCCDGRWLLAGLD